MSRNGLKYLVEDTDRHGNKRYYVRRPGQSKIRIRERFEDENGEITRAFMDAYWAALDGKPAEPTKTPRQGTFNWLVDQYLKSPSFKSLDPATQRVRKSILYRFCDTAGELPYLRFRQDDVIRSRDKRAHTPGAADNLVKALRRLFNWAMAQNIVHYNPTFGVEKIHHSEGWHTWLPEEVDRFRDHFPIGTKPRLALELLIGIGARRSDAAHIGRQHESRGWLKFTAYKDRKKHPVTIEVPIRPHLREALDATPTGDLTYIVGEQGKPYTIESFGNMFRKWCNQADLPHCSAHGLRKAAAVMLAENGASASELCAVFGWTRLSTAEKYIEKARRRLMAGNAFARLDDYRDTRSVPLSKDSPNGGTKRRKNDGKSTAK